MAGLIDEYIQKARQLLAEAEAEYQKAQQEIGWAVITTLQNSHNKAWLAVLEASNAFFLKQGVPQDELLEPDPDTDLDKVDLLRLDVDREIRKVYYILWGILRENMFIFMFEYVPEHFEELRGFINSIEAAPVQDRVAE